LDVDASARRNDDAAMLASLRGRVQSSLEAVRHLVPLSLRFRVWQRRALRSVRGGSRSEVERLFARVAATVDRKRLRRLHALNRDAPFELEEACDHERKLRVAIVKAMVMRLHESKPLRILDIGHGGGYFATVCRELGHSCAGTEVPIERLPPGTAEAYAEITAALGFHDEQRLLVEALHPLALRGEYDVICAHKICFNGHQQATEWGTSEWRFFVEDVRRLLAPGGRLVLELNENVARYGRLRWYDAALHDYFASVGTVAGNWITIER